MSNWNETCSQSPANKPHEAEGVVPSRALDVIAELVGKLEAAEKLAEERRSALARMLANETRLQQERDKLLGALECANNTAKRRGEERDRLRAALEKLLNLRETIECMGEWSAMDINRSAYQKHLLLVDAAVDEAHAALCAPEPKPEDTCQDCPPAGYPTDKTRCDSCPRGMKPEARIVHEVVVGKSPARAPGGRSEGR